MNNDTEKRTETHACDCISRAAVIDALYDWSEHSMTDAEAWHIRQVIGDIKSLPPAEPNCSEIPNNSDCISRQTAITAIQKAYADTEGGTDKCAVWKNVGLTNALHIMQDLPSAQSASYRQVTGKLDCISRQAAIDRINGTGYADQIKSNLILILRMLPSAERPGRWIGVMRDDGEPPRLEECWCSNCYEYAPLMANDKEPNYCPNCGARMEVEHE